MEYDDLAKGYTKLYYEEQINKLKIIEKHIKIKPEFKLLDVGAGTGISTVFFKCDCIGIEPSKKMIRYSKGKVIHGFGENLRFADKSFDIVLCLTAIHNFNDYKKGIQEMKRVLKDDGACIITILKVTQEFNNIKKEILRYFNSKEYDESKALILISKKII